MSGKYLQTAFSPENTPQTQAIPGREAEMTTNEAGGVSFILDPWKQLERFLILGTEGGTYYTDERSLTIENAKNVKALLEVDGVRVVNFARDISLTGRAISNDPALFVLAMATVYGSEPVRAQAYWWFNEVARTLSHMYSFFVFRSAMGQRNMGAGMRRAVQRWFLDKTPDQVAYQVTKYQQRMGWSARDILKMARPKAEDAAMNAVLRYAVKGEFSKELPEYMYGVQAVGHAESPTEAAEIITGFGLPRETVPTQFLKDPEIWDALLHAGDYGMPMTAMVRNLGNMSKSGLLGDLSEAAQFITEKLRNEDAITRSRIHPIQLLLALKQYGSGGGNYGGEWKPSQQVLDALEDAFYLSFTNVEPTGKRFLIGVDVSGSMSGYVSGKSNLTHAEAAAAVAMVIARTESQYVIHGFSHVFKDLNISAKDSLKTVLKKTRDNNFGMTDAAIPMKYAEKNKIPVDAFVVISDGATYAGTPHPSTALKGYRQKLGIPSKLLALNTVPTWTSIADPKDAGMLDVVGFDANVPLILSEFVK